MAFPTVSAQAVTNNGGNNASFTMPAFTAGQLLLGITGSLTAPTGATSGSGGTWTLVGTTNLSSTSFLRVWAKIAQTSDTLVLAGGFSSGGYVLAIDNWSGSVSDIGYAAITSSIDPPNLNMTTARDYLWLTGAYNYQNNITAAPTNYTNLTGATFNTSPAGDHKFALARRTLNASAENPGVFTTTTSFPAAWTIAITPVLLTVWPGAATFAGEGAMTIPAVPVHPGAAGWSGSGSMTTAGLHTAAAATNLAGAGSLAVDATRVRPAAVSWAGEGQFSAGGPGSQFAGTGSLTVAGTRVQPGAASWAGAGAFTIGGTRVQPGLVGWAGAGLLTVTGTRIRPSAAGWSGSGSMSVAGTRLGPLLATRIAPARALNGSGVVGSKVTWEEWTPDGGTVSVFTSINGGLTWVSAVNGWPVRDLLQGNTSARAVLTKSVLTRVNGDDPSPWIDKLVVDVEENKTRVEWIPLGVFDLEDAEVSDDENGVEITVTGNDISGKVAANAWEGIFTQPAGANLGQVIQTVISDRQNGAVFNFVSTDQVAQYPLTFGARDENNPLQDVTDIAVRLGNELYVDAFGVWTMRPEPDPELGDPVFTFSDRVRTSMTKLRRRLTKSETKNYIVVTGESVANAVPARGVAYDDDPTSASYWLGRLGKRVLRVTSKLVGDDNAAITMARALLLKRKNLTETVSISAIPNAAVQESDIVAVDRAVSKLAGNFLVDSMSIPFDAESEMTIEARRQRLAASSPVGGGVGGLDGDPGSGGGGTPSPTTFRVAFTSCCNGSDSSAYTDIKNAQPDFFFHLGDVWYDDGSSNHVSHWNAQMGASNFAALLAALPNPPVIGWSDHDFGFANNATGVGNSITATANAAYRTKFPSVALPANGIYRTWSRGRVRFIYLDCLTFKSPLGSATSTSRTMLGSTQKSWFKSLLADGAFPMIVVIGDGQWGGPAESNQDEWRGYAAERSELASAFSASPATVIYLEGDTHSLGIGRDKYGIDRIWRASPIYNNTKVKAAGADYDETYPTNDNEDETGFHKHYGIIEFADTGSDITATFRGYGDGALQMTDTVTVNAPGGTGGGTTPGGTSIGSLLKIGATTGYNSFNVGVGESAGLHVDHDRASIEAGFTQSGYFELASGRAKLSAHLDGGTTSGSDYPRVEFREMELNGTTKAAWDPDASGYHYCKVKARVTKRPPNKPEVIVLQAHDASDDVATIRVSGSNVFATLGNSTVATLSSSFTLNTDYFFMIRVEGTGSASVVKYYWSTSDGFASPAYTSSSAGRSGSWYFKAGCYSQSNSSTDSTSDGPMVVEMSKLECSRTGYPSPVGWL